MHRVKIGIASSVIVALLVGAAFWGLVTWQSSSAEATVSEACSNIAATESFDVNMIVDYSDRLEEGDVTLITAEISGDKYRIITRHIFAGEADEAYFESIYDGAGTDYFKISTDDEWMSASRTPKEIFPFNRNALCPDLESMGEVVYLGEETADGVALRKYSLDTEGFDWLVWIDAEGWLTKVQLVEIGPSGASERPVNDISHTATVTGRGEANEIEIPTDAVSSDSPRDISR